MAFTADSGPELQAQLDRDPRYVALRAQFQRTQAPLDWVALTQYVNTVLNAGGNNSRTGHVQVDGTGSVQMQNANNRWTSPATWGPVAVGGATLGAGLLGGWGGSGGSAVTNAAAAGTGPATVAPTIPTTMGIESATSLGLPATEGLGTAGAAAAAGIPTTYGLQSGDGVGTNVGQPSMDDVGGLVPGATYPNGVPGGGLPGSLLDSKWSPLLKALAGVGGLLGGKLLGGDPNDNVPPQLTQLLDLAMQRANAQTPLFNATQKGFYDMLPTFAKNGRPPGGGQ